MTLTVERVRELLGYDPETGILTWKVCRGGSKQWSVAGTLDARGYVQVCVDYRLYKAHRLAWAITHGSWPSGALDHINGAKHDNRIANLREATRSLNMENQKKAKSNNTSGLLGVSWNTRKRKFVAQIKTKGVHTYLGAYDSKYEAYDAYITAKRQLHAGCTI